MAQQQLRNLQEALNSLVKGRHGVILNPTVCKVLPTAISHIALNNSKQTTLEALLSQLSIATQATNPKIKLAAVSCILSTAKILVGGAHWNQLKGMVPTIKLIAGRRDFNENIRTEAGKIISNLESIVSAKKKKAAKPLQEKKPQTVQEKQIFKIAESGDLELAKRKLFDLVVACTRKKDFFNAERLRDRIYEIDSMAVMEITQLNEIIDTEKSKSIGKHDLEKWTELREQMTEDEFSRLFYSMDIRAFKSGTTFVSKGEINDELYFINLGNVSVTYGEAGNERVLKTLETGDIFGENFFDYSYWTVTLTALEPTKVLVLKRDKYDELEKINPELESTLQGFYQGFNDIEQLIRLKRIERRKHERYKIERGIHVQLGGGKGSKPTHFKANLIDISQGGLAFGLRITNKDNIRLLLSKGARISVPPATGGTSKFLRGTIIGVRLLDSITCDCSVHVKFAKEIEYEAFTIFLY